MSPGFDKSNIRHHHEWSRNHHNIKNAPIYAGYQTREAQQKSTKINDAPKAKANTNMKRQKITADNNNVNNDSNCDEEVNNEDDDDDDDDDNIAGWENCIECGMRSMRANE